MTLTISKTGVSQTLTVVPGTFKCSDVPVDAGGGELPLVRTNRGLTGSCDVVLDLNFTYADAWNLISGPGLGEFTVSAPANCTNAIVDVTIAGNGAQVASIKWKGEISAS